MKTNVSSLLVVVTCALPLLSHAQGNYLSDPTDSTRHSVTVAPGGNVGIGTSVPQAQLDVAGDAAVGSTHSFLARYNDSLGLGYAASLGWNALQLGNNGANYIIGGRTAPNGSLRFVTGTTNDYTYGAKEFDDKTVMTLLAGGRVGIGTSVPQAQLDVAGDTAVGNAHRFLARYNDSLGLGYAASLGWNALQLGNNGANYIIAGRTTPNGSLRFVTGTTNDYSYGAKEFDDKTVMTLAGDGSGNIGIGTTSPHARLEVAGKLRCEVLELTSDRATKAGVRPIDIQGVLDKLASLSITAWHYSNSPDVQHIGPMAQDFSAAFGLGESDKHISVVDGIGVALAAIQGLQAELRKKDDHLGDLEQELVSLRQNILARLTKLEDRSGNSVNWPSQRASTSSFLESAALHEPALDR